MTGRGRRYEAIIDDDAWRVYDRRERRSLGPPGPNVTPMTREQCEAAAARCNAALESEARVTGHLNQLDTRERERGTGRFIHGDNSERLCVCGHTLGHHTAMAAEGRRPCFESDFDPTCTCRCSRFKPQRRRSITAMRALARRRIYDVLATTLEHDVGANGCSAWVDELVEEDGISIDEVREEAGKIVGMLRGRAAGRQVR